MNPSCFFHFGRLGLAVSLGAYSVHGAHAPAHVLPPVDVLASPIVAETTVSDYGAQTTTVGADQIAALNAVDLASALRRTPGVSITRYNPVGAFGGGEGGAVFLRGLGSSRPGGEIKTMLDGVPVSNGVFNHALLDLLPVELAGGVDVIRRADPISAGNMFAGVNVRTPRVAQPGAFVRAGISAGSFGGRGERFEAGSRFDRGEVFFGQNYRRADGHRPDARGELANALLRGAWKPWEQLELSYVLHWTDNSATDPGPQAGSGLPATRGDVYATEAWLHIATASWQRTHGRGSLKLSRNDGEANWYRRTTSANADSLNDYRISGVRWREEQQFGRTQVTGGVDVEWTRGTTISVPPGTAPRVAFGPETARLGSAYLGVKHTLANVAGWEVTPSAAARSYRHQWFGDVTTPQAAVVARRGAWQWHASASRAVNYPGLEVAAFSTVAIPALGQSWRTLGPERLAQTEIGGRWEFLPDVALEATWFRNRGRDRFVFVPPPPPPIRFMNVERFETEGVEVMFTGKVREDLSLFAGLARVDVTPADVPYAPETSLTGGLTWKLFEALTLNVDASYVSSQYAGSQARGAGAPNLERVGAFALVNARLGYRWATGSRLQAEIYAAAENLLDRDYRYRPGYPMPGTGWTFGLNVRY